MVPSKVVRECIYDAARKSELPNTLYVIQGKPNSLQDGCRGNPEENRKSIKVKEIERASYL